MVKRTWIALVVLALGIAALAAAPGGIVPGPAPMPAGGIVPNVEMARQNAEAEAANYLAEAQGRLGLGDENLTFLPRSTDVDPFGASHVRFAQFYRGIPVFGQEVIAHVNNAVGGVFALTTRVEAVPDLDVTPSFGAHQAVRMAKEQFRALRGPGKASAQAELFIYPNCSGYDLAYVVRVSNVMQDNLTPAEHVFVIDARSGATIADWDDLHTVDITPYTVPKTATGHSYYSADVTIGTAQKSDLTASYSLVDPSRGNSYTMDMLNKKTGGALFVNATNVWGDHTLATRATIGVDGHFGQQATWDFYKLSYGRNGIFNDGKGAYSRVHYSRSYNNAFWSSSCKCMTYGDGDGTTFSPLTSLDVAAHEMSHGVTAATSALIYSGESGGMNESFSDIMACGVEFWAAAHGATTVADYWIGEDIYTPKTAGDALRYMDDPKRDGRSIDHYSLYTSSIDVHYSSGIWNNMFYLLAAGGTNKTSGISVTGIGIDKALAICYLANTGYFDPSETFAMARQDCIAAATQLYGASSTEVTRVGQAWTAVGVN